MHVRTRALVAVTALLWGLAGCGGTSDPPAAAAPTGPVAGPDCPDQTEPVRKVTFDGGKLVGVVLGTGSTGIVLAHQNGGSVCQWLDNARELATQGYRVLAFDFAGFGGSPVSASTIVDNVSAAAAFLRTDGAARIVLIGASMGGTASVAAAAVVTPPVAAVISLSGPAVFNGADALAAAPRLTMPVLYLAAEYESSFADAATQLYAASRAAPGRRLLLSAGSGAHGVALVQPGIAQADAVGAMNAFLREHAPA